MQPKVYFISYNNGSNTDISQALHWNYFFVVIITNSSTTY